MSTTNLYQHLLARIDEQCRLLEKQLEGLQQDKAGETKSSVGDKYETGRAMLQREEAQYRQQLGRTLELRRQLLSIPTSPPTDTASPGCLITTDRRAYFLAVSWGKLEWSGQEWFCISTASPIGQLLVGRREGDSFAFNGKKEVIQSIQKP